MMPMFRTLVRSRTVSVFFAICSLLGLCPSYDLLTEMSESPVRFSHAVRVVFLLDRRTLTICSVHQFIRQLFRHVATTASTCILKNPSHCQRDATLVRHFYRNLIGCTANSHRLDFDGRLHRSEEHTSEL